MFNLPLFAFCLFLGQWEQKESQALLMSSPKPTTNRLPQSDPKQFTHSKGENTKRVYSVLKHLWDPKTHQKVLPKVHQVWSHHSNEQWKFAIIRGQIISACQIQCQLWRCIHSPSDSKGMAACHYCWWVPHSCTSKSWAHQSLWSDGSWSDRWYYWWATLFRENWEFTTKIWTEHVKTPSKKNYDFGTGLQTET